MRRSFVLFSWILGVFSACAPKVDLEPDEGEFPTYKGVGEPCAGNDECGEYSNTTGPGSGSTTTWVWDPDRKQYVPVLIDSGGGSQTQLRLVCRPQSAGQSTVCLKPAESPGETCAYSTASGADDGNQDCGVTSTTTALTCQNVTCEGDLCTGTCM